MTLSGGGRGVTLPEVTIHGVTIFLILFSVSYLDKLMMTPSWHRDSIVYCMELLENTDQAVRKGACYMLGRFRAVESVPHLKYMAKVDFPEIQAAAYKALGQLGRYCVYVRPIGYVLRPCNQHVHRCVLYEL